MLTKLKQMLGVKVDDTAVVDDAKACGCGDGRACGDNCDCKGNSNKVGAGVVAGDNFDGNNVASSVTNGEKVTDKAEGCCGGACGGHC